MSCGNTIPSSSIEPSWLPTAGGIRTQDFPHTPLFWVCRSCFPPGLRPVSFCFPSSCKFNISFANMAKYPLVCSEAKLMLRFGHSCESEGKFCRTAKLTFRFHMPSMQCRTGVKHRYVPGAVIYKRMSRSYVTMLTLCRKRYILGASMLSA